MRNKRWRLLTLLFPFMGMIVSGCATPTMSPSEFIPPKYQASGGPQVKVSLGTVSFGYVPANPSEGEMLRQALRLSLLESGIFDTDSVSSLNVELRNLVVDGDAFGFDMNARASGTYIVKTTYGKSLFEETFNSSGVSKATEHFIGVERLNRGVRRAFAANISMFIKALGSYLSDNSEKVEGLASGPPETAAAIDNTKEPSKASTSFGTSFAIDSLGHLLTNSHVVNGCESISITVDGREEIAVLLSEDKQNDLALLKVNASLKNYALFRPSPGIRPGDSVVIFGYPLPGILSSQGSVTTGTITAMAGLGDDTRMM